MEAEASVVVDVGTTSIKAGYSGADAPRVIVRNALEVSEDNTLLGVVQRGAVSDWSAFGGVLERILEEDFAASMKPSKEAGPTSILLTQAPLADHRYREEAAQLLFEQLDVPSICIAPTAVMSLFASGRTTGLALECGGGCTHSVPVFEGFALAHATLTSRCAGQDITRSLQASLAAGGHDLDFPTVKAIKDSVCYVRHGGAGEGPEQATQTTYELPDGTVLDLQPSTCHEPGEIIFAPEAARSPFADMAPEGGLVDMARSSVGMCDRELQKALLSNIVLAGGTTMMTGFVDRAVRDLRQAFSGVAGADVQVFPDGSSMQHSRGFNSQRRHAAWIGGSMFASLPTFKDIRITKQEYEQEGDIVERRRL